MSESSLLRFNKKKVAVLFLILLLPSFFYVILSKGDHRYKALPFIGPKELAQDGSGDTIYHTIPAFTFINQDGEEFTEKEMEGYIYVVDFFFTSCPTICPKMSYHLKETVQNKFKDRDDVKILSHTVDPENDTPEVLKEYADRVHADLKNWTFVTGEKEELYKHAFNGYFASAGEDETAPGGFLHSELIFLVDKQGRLRGTYDDNGNIVPAWDGTSTSDMKKLTDAIDNLLFEELRPVKEKS